MGTIKIIILAFSLIGAADYLVGNKFGIGKEFEKAFSLFCPMALSMLGMIVIAPGIGVWLTPIFNSFYNAFGIDPSIVPASIFANDMGGMSLAQSVCKSEAIGNFNAFVVSSMMGCVISFTIPFSLGVVKKEQHKELFFGLLCGIATTPIGCFVAGLICMLDPLTVLLNLLPLILLSGISDIVDGWIARRFAMVSDFGKILDPVADKLTQAALLVCLLSQYRLMWAVIAVFTVREIMMIVMGIVSIQKSDEVNSAKWYGKVNTVVLYGVVVLLILFPTIPTVVANLLLLLCCGVIAMSLVLYTRFYYLFLKQNQKEKTSK